MAARVGKIVPTHGVGDGASQSLAPNVLALGHLTLTTMVTIRTRRRMTAGDDAE
jgi:hypothetical protein